MAGFRCLGLGVFLFVVGVLLISNINGVNSESCDGAVRGLRKECSKYVMKLQPKLNPTKTCCDVIKKADVLCVCKQLTPAAQLLIDVDKVVDVAKACGKSLPSGAKCGTVSIP